MNESLDTSEREAREPGGIFWRGNAQACFVQPELKYIHLKHGGFVVFPEHLMHSDVADNIEDTTVSAGFVRFVDGKPECYGNSLSLGVNSDPGDTKALREFWGLA